MSDTNVSEEKAPLEPKIFRMDARTYIFLTFLLSASTDTAPLLRARIKMLHYCGELIRPVYYVRV